MRDRVAIRHEHLPRCRAILSACALGTLLLSGCETRHDDDPHISLTQELPLNGNEPVVITRELAAGTWLVEAREQDIELRLVLDAPGSHTELIDAVPRHGLLAKVITLASPATLRIELHSADHRTKLGTVRLRIGEWNSKDGSAPGERQLAFTAFGDAAEQTALASKESWTRAVELLHEASGHFANAGDGAGVAQAQYTLGHLQYLQRDDRPAAIRAADEAAEAYRGVDDQTGVQRAAVLRAASELELASGMNAGTQRAEQRAMFEAADRRLADAARYFTEHKLDVSAAYAVNMRGVRANYYGDQEKAAQFLSQAVQMARANRDVGEEVKSLANLAWVHYMTGHIAEAAEEYGQLLPLIERDRQANLYAAILHNRGMCLIALGEFDRALSLHTEALAMYKAQGQDFEQSRQLLALGSLYLRTGDLQRALDTLRPTMDVQSRIGDTIGHSTALRLAGNAASALGQHDLALDYLRKSASIDVNANNVARTRVLIASELRALGNLRAAAGELQQALQSANLQGRAEALDERGRLQLAQRNLPAAIADLRAADQQFLALGLDFHRIDTNATLAQALLASRDVKGAIAAADEAVALVGRIRVNSANPEWRARFVSMRYLPYEARIAAELATATGDDQGAAWRAFRIAEEVRARSLTDLLDRKPGASSATDAREEALRAQLTAQQLRLDARLQDPSASESGTQDLRRALIETRARIDTLRAQSSGVAATEFRLTRSIEELQSSLPADTAVLAYFVGDSTTHAWLITRQQLRHAQLGGRAEMTRVTDVLVEAQRNPAAASASDRALGAKLLGSLFDGVREKRLLVIPDGPLNGLPFAALPFTQGSVQQQLLDRFIIGYSPSISLALRAGRTSTARQPRVAVISDPVYAADDRRLAMAGGGNLRSRPRSSPNNLTRLPYSGLEARAVIKALPGGEHTELSGFDATTARVLSLASSNWSVLHFATHAIARPDAPDQSALYLSEYSPEGVLLTDSQLDVAAITRSGLRADIVVLSGCETGNGGRLRGEGVLGLTYGFLANGSRSVVAALWPIEDATTARFMSEFYNAYRTSGRTAEALRTAQLRTRGDGQAAMWASFVVRANEFP